MAVSAGCTAFSRLSDRRRHQRRLTSTRISPASSSSAASPPRCSPIKGARHLRPQRVALADRQPHRRRQSARACSPSCSTRASASSPTGIRPNSSRACRPAPRPATQVINLLITSIGRDLLSLIGLVDRDGGAGPADVVLQLRGRAAGVLRAAQADPPHLRHRAQPVPRRHPHHGDAAGDAAGHPHRQGLHARRHDARALRPQRRGGRARGQQDGARLQPRQPADGDARRLRHRHRHHLWRLSRDRDRRDARPVLLLHRRLPAGL